MTKVRYRKQRDGWEVDYAVDGKRHRKLFKSEAEAFDLAKEIALLLASKQKNDVTDEMINTLDDKTVRLWIDRLVDRKNNS